MSWKSEWLKQSRLELKLRQADLAKSANVSIRTIQRAERGEKVSDENWLDFEAVLGPLPRLDDQRDAKVVLLKRVDSARALFQDLKRAGMARLGCDVEPTKDTIELLKDCVRFLEARLPRPFDFDGGQTYSPASLADELDDIATFNEQLEKLRSIGVSVYCGVPPYAREGSSFPSWKIKFLQLNRELYEQNRSWIDPWLEKLQPFDHSFQKFEWNFDGSIRSVWENIIQLRGSGIRAKDPSCAPALVAASSTQVPIIGWLRRYMTVRERARLQDLGELPHLPDGVGLATKALGNAVNAKVVELISGRAPVDILDAGARSIRAPESPACGRAR